MLALLACGLASFGDAARAEGGERLILAQSDVPAAEAPAGSAGPAPPSDVEVIRIKGRGVAAIETDVPESVTQFDAAAIEALGAQNVADLAKVTPNLEIRTAGATAATFFIRGVGLSDFSANAAGAVAVYQDDVAMNAPALQLGQIFDVENVEVLRGPQGGGSGRNASAGAIKIYSRKPTGEYTANMRASFGRYSTDLARNALTQDYEGALEAPIVEEMLAARFAFRLVSGDPYIKNDCGDAPPISERPNPRAKVCNEGTFNFGYGPTPAGLDTHLGDRGVWAARGQLRFQPPGTEMDWLLNLHGSRLDQQSTVGQAIGTRDGFGFRTEANYIEPDQQRERAALLASGLSGAEVQQRIDANLAKDRPLDLEPYRGDYDRTGQTTLDTWGAALRGDFSVGPLNFTSITGFDRYWRFRDTDQDFTPDVLFEAVTEDEAWQVSQELRVGGELADAPLRWEAGGYYLMEDLDATVDQLLKTSFTNIKREYEQKLWSFAFYGGFSWDFLDSFSLEGGVRYNWERKRFDIAQERFTIVSRNVREETWKAPTGTISLNYRFREDITAYWKYSRGWKGGHFNTNAVNAEPADPETIDAFEVGLRGRWFDGRLGFGAALFHYNYTDYQVFQFEDVPGSAPVLEIINANDAELYGAEADVRAEPLAGWAPDSLDGLVVTGRFSWLESQFLDFTDERVVVGQGGRTTSLLSDFSGNQLINAPRFKLSGSAEWTFDLGRWGWIIPRYDFAWSDDIFFSPTEGRGNLIPRPPPEPPRPNLPDFSTGQPAFWLHNLRLTYRTPGGNVEVSGWVRNLEDTVYKTYAFDASQFAKVVINFVGEPRTVGFDVSINW